MFEHQRSAEDDKFRTEASAASAQDKSRTEPSAHAVPRGLMPRARRLNIASGASPLANKCSHRVDCESASSPSSPSLMTSGGSLVALSACGAATAPARPAPPKGLEGSRPSTLGAKPSASTAIDRQSMICGRAYKMCVLWQMGQMLGEFDNLLA